MTIRTFTFEHDIGEETALFEVDINVIIARDSVTGERWVDDWIPIGSWAQHGYTHQEVIDLLDMDDFNEWALRGEDND